MTLNPTFTYLLRRFDPQSKEQAQVVVVNSSKRLTGEQLRLLLEDVTHHPASEFEEVHQEPDTAIVLDTWEPGIEHTKPSDMDYPAVKIYENWWEPRVLTPKEAY